MRNVIRNCRLCEEPMDSSPFTMCTECLQVSDRIQHIISKRPSISIEEISQLSNVSVEQIRKLAQLGFKDRMKSTAVES